MTTKPTPGPWQAAECNDGWVVFRPDSSDVVADCFTEADAKLIRAAPELLEALKLADEELCAASFADGADRKSLRYASDKARAAIAKATEPS